VTDLGRRIVEEALRSIPSVPEEFTTGGPYGVDTIAAEYGFQIYRHRCSIFRLCYPRGFAYNERTQDYANLIMAIDGGYLKRDDALVRYCNVLAAFPRTSNEERRSGTWATIRRARKAGRFIMVFPLDNSTPWREVPGNSDKRIHD